VIRSVLISLAGNVIKLTQLSINYVTPLTCAGKSFAAAALLTSDVFEY
jgi:hypothetical protein